MVHHGEDLLERPVASHQRREDPGHDSGDGGTEQRTQNEDADGVADREVADESLHVGDLLVGDCVPARLDRRDLLVDDRVLHVLRGENHVVRRRRHHQRDQHHAQPSRLGGDGREGLLGETEAPRPSGQRGPGPACSVRCQKPMRRRSRDTPQMMSDVAARPVGLARRGQHKLLIRKFLAGVPSIFSHDRSLGRNVQIRAGTLSGCPDFPSRSTVTRSPGLPVLIALLMLGFCPPRHRPKLSKLLAAEHLAWAGPSWPSPTTAPPPGGIRLVWPPARSST